MKNRKCEIKTKSKKRKIIVLLLTLVLVMCVGWGLYLADYYRADKTALEAMEYQGDDVEIKENGTSISFVPEDAKIGLIFYPGGKVQCEAYAPLMLACAKRGILCELVKMPGNLAVLTSTGK